MLARGSAGMSHRSGDRPGSEMVFKSRLSQRWSRSAEHFAALRTQDPRQLLRGLLVRERVATLPQIDILPERVIHAEPHAAHDADADRLGLLAGLRAHITPVSYTHLRAHETDSYLVCRLLLEKKNDHTMAV